MFSQLGPLFKVVFRKTEKSDARLDVPHQEKDNPQKHPDKKTPTDDDENFWEDSTTVSILALKNFLIDFLKSKGADVREFYYISETPKNAHILENQKTTLALKAYTTSSFYETGEDVLKNASISENYTTDEDDLFALLKIDELKTIHILIHELDRLKKTGLEVLVIDKADDFIQALLLAVEKAKANL